MIQMSGRSLVEVLKYRCLDDLWRKHSDIDAWKILGEVLLYRCLADLLGKYSNEDAWKISWGVL